MNLILLFDEDFVSESRVKLEGRRLQHVAGVHRAAVGDTLVVGRAGGKMGRGVVTRLDDAALELEVTLDRDPPPPLPIALVLALPRPKVLNRVIACATSMGIKRIALINAWKVEKSYWQSPRLSDENLLLQRIIGLEQARDTIFPEITIHRFFRAFAEHELAQYPAPCFALHPAAARPCPFPLPTPSTIVIGPEGGFIDAEVASLERAGCEPVSLGERVLRTETAVAAVVGRVQWSAG